MEKGKLFDSFIVFLNYIWAKLSSGFVDLFLFLCAFLAPAAPIMIAVGGAIALDTYFGRRRARHDGEEVTSKKTRVGLVEKSKWYLLVVLGLYLVDTAMVNEFVKGFFGVEYALTKLMGIVFCWIEYTSINESFKVIKGKSIGQAIKEMIRKAKNIKSDVDELKK